MSIAIWHRSEQELDKVLLESPQLINQTNSLANTPLHLAVAWPYGIRALLQHGACLNATDQSGCTSLFYAIELGITETVSILMKADCSLNVGGGAYDNDLLKHAVRVFLNKSLSTWSVRQEAGMDVLDTAISMLAERRRNLQNRLVALSPAVTVNPKVFQDDRILDEYAQYAECVEEDAMRGNDHMPRHASSLLPRCRTVYHVFHMTVEVAEKLWQNGFRDVDVPDEQGLTPLMCWRWYSRDSLVIQLEVSSWLMQKGANLHRLQPGPLNYNADSTISAMESPSVISTLHYVAYRIGQAATVLADDEYLGREKRPLQVRLHQLSEEARLLAATVFLDVSYDDCICACSSQGCLASIIMLKSCTQWPYKAKPRRIGFSLATEYLIDLVGPRDSFPDWLAKRIIRFRTFEELELRHTCCDWDWVASLFIPCDPEEHAEIRDEDHEKIELLESLLQEFEEHRGIQDVLSFLNGYWAMRMDQVLREQGHVDKEALREIGVVLHEVDEEGSDGEGNDGEGNDGEGNDEEESDRELGDDDD